MTREEVDMKVAGLIVEAQSTAKRLGRAVAICRHGSEFFVADSWSPVHGRVLRLVGSNGIVVSV